MRIFCPEHSRGFFAPRQNPIKCENRGHVLGEFDFEGEAKPAEVHWQYCCNCEHFCPTAVGQDLIQHCPVCARQSSLRYLCDRCYTISFESNTPTQTKNFTLTSEGAPQPSCPGCLQSAAADLREHTCDALGVTFVTALSACPICHERLDVAPAFPCSVAYYLKKTRAGNKLNVTFDYESGLFVRVEDGEFVLIANGNDAAPIVLPRFARFNTRRHFYDFYQDYYHCANPGAGEVQIIQPAAVEQVNGGWTLKAPGVLAVLGQQTNGNAPLNPTRNLPVTPPPKMEPAKEEIREQRESALVPCPNCDSLVETKYAFCWNCGELIKGNNEPSVTRSARPAKEAPSAPFVTEDEEPTSQHRPVHASPSIFSWASQEDPDENPSGSHSVLKLIALVLVGVLLASLGLFVLLPWALRTNPTMAGQAAKQELQSSKSTASDTERSGVTAPSQPQAANSEDQALNRIRQRRDSAEPSDHSAVLTELVAAEKQYPNDYRFPYERAKLLINAQETHSHHEAFAALLLAAEKAIRSGKADEMLSSLEADKDRDLRKLSRGHGEWTQLESSLRNRDKNLLNPKTHH